MKENADCLNENATLNNFTTRDDAVSECNKTNCWGITHFFGLNPGLHSRSGFLVCKSNATVYMSSHSLLYYG